jgi:hypothetical protein
VRRGRTHAVFGFSQAKVMRWPSSLCRSLPQIVLVPTYDSKILLKAFDAVKTNAAYLGTQVS